jgi:hypothetical protein
MNIDWKIIAGDLNSKGFSLIKSVLTPEQCNDLTLLYDHNEFFRSTINMERYRFGRGEYKYFDYPLPGLVQQLRETFYTPLSDVANEWMSIFGSARRFPAMHSQLLEECHAGNQNRPTPLILRYATGGYNTVHQDLYGEVYFPFQVVFVLSQAGQDYDGGELVLLQQNPRAQSKANVVQPDRGDALIFTTNFRPVAGTRGYYRATMKHGVSEIRRGIRHSLGIIFHDAS